MEYIKQYEFQPDYRNVVKVARNEWVQRLPLYEHLIGEKAIYDTTGLRPYDTMFSQDMDQSLQGFADYWSFWKTMGYDTASMEFLVSSILPGGGALGDHKDGCIKERADFTRYPWAELPAIYFDRYAPYIRNFAAACPAGMKAVGGVGNGLFECVQDIVGYIDLCYIRSDDEDLYADLFRAMGDAQARIWDRFMKNLPMCSACFVSGMTLAFIRRHCCQPAISRGISSRSTAGSPIWCTGQASRFFCIPAAILFSVFDDMIRDAGIDAKHSNEDAIAPFSVWVKRCGARSGTLAGSIRMCFAARLPRQFAIIP